MCRITRRQQLSVFFIYMHNQLLLLTMLICRESNLAEIAKIANALVEGPIVAASAGLDDLLDGPVGFEDEIVWAGLNEAQREKTIQRIKALNRYLDPKDDISAKQAAADAGVKLNRFYQLARAWKDERSMRTVGARALPSINRQKLKPAYANALQAVVKSVVANAQKSESINSLARKLGKASGLAKPPVLNTLRKFIEKEQRRQRRETSAGTELLFDLSASSFVGPDGHPYVIFLVIDRATGIILGHSSGSGDNSVAGYQGAAANARWRMSTPALQLSIWSDRFERAQFVPGSDVDELVCIVSQLAAAINRTSIQPTSQGKSGQYIRRHVGLKIGTIRLAPARTFTAAADTQENNGPCLSLDEAFAKTELAVTAYNAEILSSATCNGACSPPATIMQLLGQIADH